MTFGVENFLNGTMHNPENRDEKCDLKIPEGHQTKRGQMQHWQLSMLNHHLETCLLTLQAF
jgi:hypothetical protein